MKRFACLIFGCFCVVLLFGDRVHTQRRRQPPQKSTGSKTATVPSGPQKPKRNETIAEKLVLEGICKSPSPSVWITASNIDIPSSSRSESTLFRMPDVILRAELLFHILSASSLKHLYETRSYKTDIFPDAYKQHEAGLKNLLAKVEAFKNERGSVSSTDRNALYPVIKAYFIDAAITVQEMPKQSMPRNFADAYRENEKAIAALASSKPEEGLNPYADKETPLVKVMTAYLIDFAVFVRDSYQSTSSGNVVIAYEQNKAKIGVLAAKNWKSDQLSGEERDALSALLSAGSVDVANLLRGAYKASNKGVFAETYGKDAADIESLANRSWEKDSVLEFAGAAPALCRVLTAYGGYR